MRQMSEESNRFAAESEAWEKERRALEATTNSVRQDLELSEAHAETLTQELADARVLASKAEALSEQRQAEAEERSSLASKVEEAERIC